MESGSLTLTGVEISKSADGTVDADQPKYAEKLVEVPTSKLKPNLVSDVSYRASHAASATWRCLAGTTNWSVAPMTTLTLRFFIDVSRETGATSVAMLSWTPEKAHGNQDCLRHEA